MEVQLKELKEMPKQARRLSKETLYLIDLVQKNQNKVFELDFKTETEATKQKSKLWYNRKGGEIKFKKVTQQKNKLFIDTRV